MLIKWNSQQAAVECDLAVEYPFQKDRKKTLCILYHGLLVLSKQII